MTSNAADTSTLELQAGVAKLDGAQSSGSSVSGYVTGALATRTGTTPVTGQGDPVLPPGAGSRRPRGARPHSRRRRLLLVGLRQDRHEQRQRRRLGSGCPRPRPTSTRRRRSTRQPGIISRNSGGTCGQLSYDNLARRRHRARPVTDPLALRDGRRPVRADPGRHHGSGPSIAGSGYVWSNPLPSSPAADQGRRVGGRWQARVVLFPNSPEPTVNATFGGKGLVAAILDQGSVDCVSGTSGVDGTIVGKYTLRLFWWGQGHRRRGRAMAHGYAGPTTRASTPPRS